MTEIKNRVLTYEVSGLTEGRWTIDCILPDEAEAIAHGRELLQAKRYEEIKVVRQRKGPKGMAIESEILHETGRDLAPPLALAGDPADVPLCRDAQSLFGLDARLAAGRLLRRYLERERITATELFYVWPYMRRFDDKGAHLLAAALHKVAAIQAGLLGITARERLKTLDSWLGAVMDPAREFGVLRRKLCFELTDLPGSLRRIDAATTEPEQRQYLLTAGLCYAMMGLGSIGGRLEFALRLASDGPDPRLMPILKDLIADAIAFPEVTNDFMATAPRRSTALTQLANAVTGHLEPVNGERVDPALAAFAALHAKLRLDRAADVLVDRVVREIGSGKPLDPHDGTRDEALFQQLLPHLRGRDGLLLGGQGMQQAIANYRLRQRQRVLRGMGMHDQANALEKCWSVEMVEQLAPLALPTLPQARA